MSSTNRFITFAVLPIVTLIIGWQAGTMAAGQDVYTLTNGNGDPIADPEENVDIGLLWNVWRLLQTKYIEVDDLDTRKMVLGAVSGMVQAVGDPYTVFMTPKENTDFRESLSGHLQGIGAQLSQSGSQIIVVTPLKGSPAEAAGMLPEDIILGVNDEDVSGMSLEEVVAKVRGPKGTSVTLTIGRKSTRDVVTMTIKRDDITVPSAEYEVKNGTGGNVGLLTINQFGDETISEIRDLLSTVDASTLKGFIIDLRYNGGGYLDGAVDLVSMFQKEGLVVEVAGRGSQPQRHYVTGRTILPNLPLVVLVNEGSASASEITAGALQDSDRATIVGVKSFGKGTVQEVIDLTDGTSLRVTVAHWLTPKGRNLSKEGVMPDVIVERTREQILAGQDPQLDKAMEVLLQ
jgi:carboxyl-terminal processing protease